MIPAPFQQRAIEEKQSLDDKIRALNRFIKANDIYARLTATEQNLLAEQLEVMQRYSELLRLRILDWNL